nr:nuclear protein UL55 [Psittacid alphaherpesvirus 6]
MDYTADTDKSETGYVRKRDKQSFMIGDVCVDRLGARFIADIPDVLQIVTPLALDVEIRSHQDEQPTQLKSPSFLFPRYYHLRCACKARCVAHVYFLGLATAPTSADVTSEGASKIAQVMNDQRIVMSLHRDLKKCDAPFSHGTITDLVDDESTLKIEGLCFHCHCNQAFSKTCWTSAFSVAEKAAFVCKELRKAKVTLTTATVI